MSEVQHVELVSANGDSRVVVSTWGGRVVEWKHGGRDILFRSALFDSDEVNAPHVGIPVLFPQFGRFGDGEMHGFVRNRNWRIESINSGECTLVLLSADHRLDETSGKEFSARVSVRLDDGRLSIGLEFVNASMTQPLVFTTGLHTYLAVEDLATARVLGLQGSNYLDAADQLAPAVDLGRDLSFPACVDRVYVSAPSPIALVARDLEISIDQVGFEDCVVWNPGSELGPQFDDMADDEWRKFVCIEAAQIQNPVILNPGESWTGSQTLTVR